ncbi:hypothetical protein ACFOWU_17350 [Epilithonimonas zeae]|nr:hypothetical protein [Epilithonimonas zeae]
MTKKDAATIRANDIQHPNNIQIKMQYCLSVGTRLLSFLWNDKVCI